MAKIKLNKQIHFINNHSSEWAASVSQRKCKLTAPLLTALMNF